MSHLVSRIGQLKWHILFARATCVVKSEGWTWYMDFQPGKKQSEQTVTLLRTDTGPEPGCTLTNQVMSGWVYLCYSCWVCPFQYIFVTNKFYKSCTVMHARLRPSGPSECHFSLQRARRQHAGWTRCNKNDIPMVLRGTKSRLHGCSHLPFLIICTLLWCKMKFTPESLVGKAGLQLGVEFRLTKTI